MLHKTHRDPTRSLALAEPPSGDASDAISGAARRDNSLQALACELMRGRDLLILGASRIESLECKIEELEQREQAAIAAEEAAAVRATELQRQVSALLAEVDDLKAGKPKAHIGPARRTDPDRRDIQLNVARRDAEQDHGELAGWIAECEALLVETEIQSDALATLVRDRDEAKQQLHAVSEERNLLSAQVDRLTAALRAEEAANGDLISAVEELQEFAIDFAELISAMPQVRAELTSAMHGAYDALAQSEERAATAERDLRLLSEHADKTSVEVSELRSQLSKQEAAHQSALEDVGDLKAALESSQGLLRSNRSTIDEAERRMHLFEVMIADKEKHIGTLLRDLDSKERELSQASSRANDLEQELADVKRENASLDLQMEAVQKAALSDKAVLSEYVDSLRVQVAKLPELQEACRALTVQTEDLITRLQGEATEMSTLIDSVQTSHFWKLKRFLRGFRSALLRR